MHQSAMYLTMHAMIFTTEQLRQAPERILQITDLILKNINMEIHRLKKKSIFYVRQKQLQGKFFFQKFIFMSTNQKISMHPICDQKMLIPSWH